MCFFCWVVAKAVPNTTEADAFPLPHLSLCSETKMVIQPLPVDHGTCYGPEPWQWDKASHCKPLISPGEECNACHCREPPEKALAKPTSTLDPLDMGLFREGIVLRNLVLLTVFSTKNGTLSLMPI